MLFQFWKAPRDWIKVTGAAAKKAAVECEVSSRRVEVMGLPVESL